MAKDEAPKGWDISATPIHTYLTIKRSGSSLNSEDVAPTIPQNPRFTSLVNARRTELEIAEQLAATGEKIVDNIVTYPAVRLALFETTALLETEIQIESEDTLKPLAIEAYEVIKSDLGQALVQLEKDSVKQAKKEAKLLISAITSHSSSSFFAAPANIEKMKMAEKIYQDINARYKSGEYIPAEFISRLRSDEDKETSADIIKQVAIMVLEDALYRERMQHVNGNAVRDLIKRRVQQFIEDKQLKRLTMFSGDARHTFMLAGAPACGKGTSQAIMEYQAKKDYNIDWANIAKNDTDVHRSIVSTPEELGDEVVYHAHFNMAEAQCITNRVNGIIREKIANDSAPHLLIDGVLVNDDRLRTGVANHGQMHLAVVTLPVDVSIDRGFQRAEKSGRYVQTAYMISAHCDVSSTLFDSLKKYAGESIEVIIYDNNVPFGEQPKTLLIGDLKTMTIEIYDPDGLAEFYGKKNINKTARSKEDLYPSEEAKKSYDYHDVLTNAGFTIKYLNEGPLPKDIVDKVNALRL